MTGIVPLEIEGALDVGAFDVEILGQTFEAVEAVEFRLRMTERRGPKTNAVSLEHAELEIEDGFVANQCRHRVEDGFAVGDPVPDPETVLLHPRAEFHVIEDHLQAVKARS